MVSVRSGSVCFKTGIKSFRHWDLRAQRGVCFGYLYLTSIFEILRGLDQNSTLKYVKMPKILWFYACLSRLIFYIPTFVLPFYSLGTLCREHPPQSLLHLWYTQTHKERREKKIYNINECYAPSQTILTDVFFTSLSPTTMQRNITWLTTLKLSSSVSVLLNNSLTRLPLQSPSLFSYITIQIKLEK